MHQEKNVTATIKVEPIILFQRKTSPGKLCEVFWAVPVIQTAGSMGKTESLKMWRILCRL